MKKGILILSLMLCFALSSFANFGMPTFDFTNLVSAIESIANAVKFYEESIKQVNEYKARIEKLGKSFSEDTIKNFLSNFKNGEEGYKNVLSSIDNLKSIMDEETEALENALKKFDSNLNEYLGINTDGTITEIGEKINTYLSPSNIESILERENEELISILSNAKERKTELVEQFKTEKEKLDSDIAKLREEIQSKENEASESQVALELLSIKTSELSFLQEERRSLEEKYEKTITEIDNTIAYYENEINRVKEATDKLISNLHNASLIDKDTEELLKEVNSYKPKYKFSI